MSGPQQEPQRGRPAFHEPKTERHQQIERALGGDAPSAGHEGIDEGGMPAVLQKGGQRIVERAEMMVRKQRPPPRNESVKRQADPEHGQDAKSTANVELGPRPPALPTRTLERQENRERADHEEKLDTVPAREGEPPAQPRSLVLVLGVHHHDAHDGQAPERVEVVVAHRHGCIVDGGRGVGDHAPGASTDRADAWFRPRWVRVPSITHFSFGAAVRKRKLLSMKHLHRILALALTLAAAALHGVPAAHAQSVSPVPAPTIITSAPYTITAAGCYQLGANLTSFRTARLPTTYGASACQETTPARRTF